MIRDRACIYDGMRADLGSEENQTWNKFCSSFSLSVSEPKADEPNHGTENNMKRSEALTIDMYSFGYSFVYPHPEHYREQGSRLYVNPKYDSMKTEIVSNPIYALPLKDAMVTFQKATNWFPSYWVRRHLRNTPTLEGIASVLFYTNFTQLCTAFSATFRKRKRNETDSNQTS